MSSPRKQLAGMKFGRLSVASYSHSKRYDAKHVKPFWNCICECGASTCISSDQLISGKTKSCGCLNNDLRLKRNYKHGQCFSPEYYSWASMKTRCLNRKWKGYTYWGGRGITICERWMSFENFLADMGVKPGPEYSLDRIDNNGNYYPENCRWATPQQQASNKGPYRRRDGHLS